jgi:hypothetical protein
MHLHVPTNAFGEKERMLDQANQSSNQELISSVLTSAIHQLLLHGKNNFQNVFHSKTKEYVRPP